MVRVLGKILDRRKLTAHVRPRREQPARLASVATDDKTPRRGETWGVGWEPFRYFVAKWPRSVFLNRASFPLVAISRRIAL